MMTKEQLIEKYDSLYDRMSQGKEVRYMQAFGRAEKWVFMNLARQHPEIAEEWLGKLECVAWENYISEKEAREIAKGIINQDGSIGFHWQADTFFSVVRAAGGQQENAPLYNQYALLVAANMIYSDHAISIAKDMGKNVPGEVPQDKMALSCYRKAMELLEDKDRNFRIRDYFSRYL